MLQVNGRLGMTRSLGDTDLKAYGVVAEPHLKSLEVSACVQRGRSLTMRVTINSIYAELILI